LPLAVGGQHANKNSLKAWGCTFAEDSSEKWPVKGTLREHNSP
jgi:hypothetical protein